jgi:hypothetical protein
VKMTCCINHLEGLKAVYCRHREAMFYVTKDPLSRNGIEHERGKVVGDA